MSRWQLGRVCRGQRAVKAPDRSTGRDFLRASLRRVGLPTRLQSSAWCVGAGSSGRPLSVPPGGICDPSCNSRWTSRFQRVSLPATVGVARGGRTPPRCATRRSPEPASRRRSVAPAHATGRVSSALAVGCAFRFTNTRRLDSCISKLLAVGVREERARGRASSGAERSPRLGRTEVRSLSRLRCGRGSSR